MTLITVAHLRWWTLFDFQPNKWNLEELTAGSDEKNTAQPQQVKFSFHNLQGGGVSKKATSSHRIDSFFHWILHDKHTHNRCSGQHSDSQTGKESSHTRRNLHPETIFAYHVLFNFSDGVFFLTEYDNTNILFLTLTNFTISFDMTSLRINKNLLKEWP